MSKIVTYEERKRILEFKKELSEEIRSGAVGIDDALIKMFVFYRDNNVEEPPFLVLKMAEEAVNSSYEEKAEFLKRLRIL